MREKPALWQIFSEPVSLSLGYYGPKAMKVEHWLIGINIPCITFAY